MKIKDALKIVSDKQRELFLIGGVISLLDWDQKTYMPRKALTDRSKQLSLLSKRAHEILLSDELWKSVTFLSDKENIERLHQKDRIIVERLKKDTEKARKIPADFIERLSRAEALSYSAWEVAKKRSRFDIFLPHLEKLVELKREYCDYIGLKGHIYNNLLDDYEEGMTYERLKNAFDYLRSRLSKLLDRFESEEDTEIHIGIRSQEKLCKIILKYLGLGRDSFRIDISEHPFTTRLSTFDVRITTRFSKKNPLSSLFSTLHEAGHAIYELNLPKGKFRYTVISDAPSLGLHESQSRFWENVIGRSYNFWKFFYPILRKVESRINLDMEDVYRHVNTVKRSMIRTDADEISYNLHVILRFELETKLIEGKIEAKELPDLWNEKMEKLIGVRPKTDREGVLQDMHWSTGDFGYFPSYTIGNIYSAQQLYSMRRDLGEMDSMVESGNFEEIKKWLNTNIHRYGRMYTSEEIMKICCGEGLNPRIFIRYLEEKFGK